MGKLLPWLILLFMGVAWGLSFSLAKIAMEVGGSAYGIVFWQSINKELIGAISIRDGILFAIIFLLKNAASIIGIPNPSDLDKRKNALHREYYAESQLK